MVKNLSQYVGAVPRVDKFSTVMNTTSFAGDVTRGPSIVADGKNSPFWTRGFKKFLRSGKLGKIGQRFGLYGLKGIYDPTSLIASTKGLGGRIASTSKTISSGLKTVGKTLWGPAGFGVGGLGKGILPRMILPGLLIGGFAAYKTFSNLMESPYSVYGPHAAWGHTPGISGGVEDTMEFSGSNNTFRELQANGSLNFALHNRRKA